MDILLVEDDIFLCQSLSFQFRKKSINTTISNDCNHALKCLSDKSFDIIILDRMLPDGDGLNLLRQIRENRIHTLVIMLTALGTLNDKVTGLDNGADDYIVKPFEFDELMARIRTLLRRPNTIANSSFSFGDLSYNVNDMTITCGDKTALLSKKEAELFEVLIKHPDSTISREEIIDTAWGENAEITNGNLDNYIYFLRKRLTQIESSVTIKNVHSVGYKLCR